MATCPTCETEFTPKSNHHPAQRYCQRACKERAAARRRRAPARQARAEAKATRTQRNLEFATATWRALEARPCAECSAPLGTIDPRARYCGRRCADRAYNKARPRLDLGCESCGVALPRGRKRCDRCLTQTRGARKRRERIRRRTLERTVIHEIYTLAEIAERDRYRCGLCRQRVAMTKVVPHPRSPTIDHVLPLAVGGHDVRANVQLAHFACNVAKRDGGTQQLALIG